MSNKCLNFNTSFSDSCREIGMERDNRLSYDSEIRE